MEDTLKLPRGVHGQSVRIPGVEAINAKAEAHNATARLPILRSISSRAPLFIAANQWSALQFLRAFMIIFPFRNRPSEHETEKLKFSFSSIVFNDDEFISFCTCDPHHYSIFVFQIFIFF